MKTGFLNDPADVEWLKDTALKGCPLPSAWQGFAYFTLQGNEDSPHAVNLYKSPDPLITDDYYRVRFVNPSGAYAEACEYDGATDKPKGGLIPLDI